MGEANDGEFLMPRLVGARFEGGVIPLDIAARLDELRSLRSGWLDGDGVALSLEGLTRLERDFNSYFPDKIAPPHLYPTPDGNISAEWSLSPFEVSLKIDLATRMGRVHSLNTTDDAEFARELNLTQPDDWKVLVEYIGKLPGGQV
jgi:hypothetical protein